MTVKTPANPPRPSKASPGKKTTLVGLVGAVAAAGLATSVPRDESGRKVDVTVRGEVIDIVNVSGDMHLKAYRDIAGIWTICDGDTKNVKPGMVETPEGCKQRLEVQLIAHAEPVLKCAPTLAEDGRDYQRWAMIDAAYNAGTGIVCGNTSVGRAVRARQWMAACDALLAWNKAKVGGVLRPVLGLTKRRNREREICMTGLQPFYSPENLKARIARWN